MRLELETRATAFPLAENGIHEDAFASVSWDFDSLLKKGVAAAQSGDRDQARKVLSQATAINPASEDAWMWLASISEYPEELLAFLNRVLDINPENEKAVEWRTATTSLLAKTFVQRALAARNDGSLDLAEQCLDQAIAHDVECESAWFWKASLAKSDEQKLAHLGRVLEINPSNSDAAETVVQIKHAQALSSLEEAKSLVAAGRRELAIALLDELVNHESAEIRESALLTMCDVAESEDQKIELLTRVLEVNPDNITAADQIASITRSRSMAAFDEAKSAAAAGDRAKAIEILDGFVRNVPDSVDAWLLKSHLSEGLDQKVEALEKALEIDPENSGARSGLAFLAMTFGSNTEAKPAPVEVQEETVEPERARAFANALVEQSASASQIDEEVEFAYRPTEESVTVEDPESQPEAADFDVDPVFEAENEIEISKPVEEIVMPHPSPTYDLSTRPDPVRSVDEIFGTFPDEADPTHETVDSRSPFAPFAMNQDPFAAEAPVSPFDQKVAELVFMAQDEPMRETTHFTFPEPVSVSNACPFCASPNEVQAFECTNCQATLTLSDIEKLLSGTSANREIVQRSVTEMEADWNTREFTEAEFTALGIGHFNLGNADNGFRYLQEASRLNPNNVILAAQVNTIAIRLEEMRRQHETYDALPKGKKILVVDDSPTVRKLISGKLEKSGHHVVCAVDGVDALVKLEEGMPDLVLLDITMPRMDGYEVCRQIRANPAGKNLPVVMISGKDGFFDKVRGRMAGTSGYVTKPFGPETLMKALDTYLLPDEVEVD